MVVNPKTRRPSADGLRMPLIGNQVATHAGSGDDLPYWIGSDTRAVRTRRSPAKKVTDENLLRVLIV